MSFNFPNAPIVGSVYTAPTGAQYIWDGIVWKQVTLASAGLRAIGPNLIVNPNFDVSQENGDTAGSTNAYYIADQWFMGQANVGTVGGARALIDSDYGGTVVNSSAIASLNNAAQLRIAQPIEGLMMRGLRWGYADAVPAVLNFKARATFAGTYSVSIINAAGTYCFVADFVLAAAVGTAWTEFTIPIPVPPGGVWPIDNTMSMYINFVHSAGATTKAPAAGWNAGAFFGGPSITNNSAVISNSLVIKDVQLRADPENTGASPKFQPLNYDQELVRCQRYYQRDAPTGYIVAGYYTGAGSGYSDIQFPTTMRVAPTIAFLSPSYSNASGLLIGNSTLNSFRYSVNSTAVGAYYAIFGYAANARLV
jgi:hypothetical protein